MTDWRVDVGDMRSVLAKMPPASVDAVVTDPPYGLGFKNERWDAVVPGRDFWAAAFRVAKPGAHMLAFGGTRTFHRMTCAIEDVGWEIRDCLMWLYRQGFPKSFDIAKGIDRKRDADLSELYLVTEYVRAARLRMGDDLDEHVTKLNERKGVPGEAWFERPVIGQYEAICDPFGVDRDNPDRKPGLITTSATDAARQWEGWGTALKPAWEPVILARKPLGGKPPRRLPSNVVSIGGKRHRRLGRWCSDDPNACGCPNPPADASPIDANASVPDVARVAESLAANVLAWGTGGINIDACRIGTTGGVTRLTNNGSPFSSKDAPTTATTKTVDNGGRWPANLMIGHLAECEELEPRVDTAPTYATSAEPKEIGFTRGAHAQEVSGEKAILVPTWRCAPGCPVRMLDAQSGDVGAASPASGPEVTGGKGFGRGGKARGEVPFQGDAGGASRFFYCPKASKADRGGEDNDHPTVKPVELMRWLVRLVTPPGAVVLDPFCGSGSTGVAARLEGVRFLGVELSEHNATIARGRIDRALSEGGGGDMTEAEEAAVDLAL